MRGQTLRSSPHQCEDQQRGGGLAGITSSKQRRNETDMKAVMTAVTDSILTPNNGTIALPYQLINDRGYPKQNEM